VCVTLHAISLVGLGRWMIRHIRANNPSFVTDLGRVIGVTWTLLLVHLMEIGNWAAFYVWKGCLPDFTTAFYFSSMTYTTVGYGDVLLPLGYRVLAGAEALTGILLAGLSTGFLFAFFSRQFGSQISFSTSSIEP